MQHLERGWVVKEVPEKSRGGIYANEEIEAASPTSRSLRRNRKGNLSRERISRDGKGVGARVGEIAPLHWNNF